MIETITEEDIQAILNIVNKLQITSINKKADRMESFNVRWNYYLDNIMSEEDKSSDALDKLKKIAEWFYLSATNETVSEGNEIPMNCLELFIDLSENMDNNDDNSVTLVMPCNSQDKAECIAFPDRCPEAGPDGLADGCRRKMTIERFNAFININKNSTAR